MILILAIILQKSSEQVRRAALRRLPDSSGDAERMWNGARTWSTGMKHRFGTQDDLARVCLAHLLWLQDRLNDSRKLALSICASSTEPLVQVVACGIVSELSGEIENSFQYEIQAEEIACSVAGHVCNRARFRLALSKDKKTWADMQSDQKASWDPEVKQTLIALNRSTVNEHVRLGALMELADCELAAGDLSIARQMLLDLIPRTAGPLPHFLQLSFAWSVCVDYMETLLRMESLHAAMHWFHQALQIPQDDLRRSKVFLVMAAGLLKFKRVDEAMEKLAFGIQLILHANAEWRPPSCYDHLTSTAGSTTRINSTCLHEVLLADPFYFDREGASLIAETPAFHSFYLTSSGMDSKPFVPWGDKNGGPNLYSRQGTKKKSEWHNEWLNDPDCSRL